MVYEPTDSINAPQDRTAPPTHRGPTPDLSLLLVTPAGKTCRRDVFGRFLTLDKGVHGGRRYERLVSMRIKSQVKAGRISLNHNEALKVRSQLKGGRIALNHNETMR